MKTMSKVLTNLCIAGSLFLGLTAPAGAQTVGRMAAIRKTAFDRGANALKVNSSGFYHPYVYPDIGVVMNRLPLGYYTFNWNNVPYYYADGLFYQSYASGSYKVTVPPLGAEIPSLPLGADIITIDGNPYFQYKGIYYESVIRPEGRFTYKVVGKDGILRGDAEADPALPLVGDINDRVPDGSHQVTLNNKTYWVTPDQIYLEEVKKDRTISYRVVWVPEKKKKELNRSVQSES